ncbi:MAG: hypothetical protein ACTSVI_11495 [Promethearchaeota archaeon]
MNDNENSLSQYLASYYFSQDPERRGTSFKFLGELGIYLPRYRNPILKLLMRALVDKSLENKCLGVYYLGELGKLSPLHAKHVIYPLILILLNSKTEKVLEFYVLNALERINKKSRTVRRFLHRGISDVAFLIVSNLQSDDKTVREEVIWKIGKLGKISFISIIDLIPIIANHLTDEDKHVQAITSKVLIDLVPASRGKIIDLLSIILEESDHFYIKTNIVILFDEIIRLYSLMREKVTKALLKQMKNPNRHLYLMINKVLRTIERLEPEILYKLKNDVIHLLKARNRHAYHWAVKIINSIYLKQLQTFAKKNYILFVKEINEMIKLLVESDNKNNIMQTRVVLMMMIHELKQIISESGSFNENIKIGLIKGLEQIQKTNLTTEIEVLAAYEKFKKIIENSNNFSMIVQ